MKIALVHDDLVQSGGAERLFEAMVEIWPEATIFTSLISKSWAAKFSGPIQLKTSFMQRLPFKEELYRFFFPLYPLAFESFDFGDFDVVLSSSARFAHGVITKPETLHIAYINSPGRMFWEASGYFGNRPANMLLAPFLSWLRMWDYVAAQRPDFLIANSKTPQARIKKYYGRDSAVIHPFVDLKRFKKNGQLKVRNSDYYLIVSRLTRWKRIDVAVEAFNRLNLPLTIIGEGPDKNRLKRLAGPTVRFLGRVADEDVVEYYKNCQAFVFPQMEDFGIAPLEALAAGRPVIALKLGGALETIVGGKTGEFFYPQTVEALMRTLVNFKPGRYLPRDCVRRARCFGEEVFKRKLRSFVNEKWETRFERGL